MIEVAIGIGGAVAFAAWVVHVMRGDEDLRRAWRSAARDAGLEVLTENTWGPSGLIGRAGEHRVLIDELNNGDRGTGTRIVIEGSSGITLAPESLVSAVEKRIGRRELELGDDVFDKEVYIRGSPEILRALCDAALREQMRHLLRGWIRVNGRTVGVEGTVSLTDGDLRAEFWGRDHETLRTNMPEVLGVLLAVALKLEKPTDVAERIAENTRTEPEWRVRKENLLMLAERYPEHHATHEALKRACQDGNDEVRLRAALALKEEGRETLLEIARRESAADGDAATAIAGLGEHLPVETAVSILDDGLRRRRTETVRACLAALGRQGGAAAVERLAKVLVEEAPDFAVAAAHALGATGAAAAETPLLGALQKELDALSTAAAAALGRVGSASAVLPLKEAAAREAPGSRLQRVVRQAVAEIQSRLQGASPGQVSLAEGETGQLSLADEDTAGRVSIANTDDDA